MKPLRKTVAMLLAVWFAGCGQSVAPDADLQPGGDRSLLDSFLPDAARTGDWPADEGSTWIRDGSLSPIVTVVAIAGDMVEAGRTAHARANAALIAGHKPRVSSVLLAGDCVRYYYIGGLLNYFHTFYRPATEADWGQFDSVAFPQTGNHEYCSVLGDAKGYFQYFAARMKAIEGLPSYHGFVNVVGKAYYSFDLNGWHVVSLNSNCWAVGGCEAGSPQETWLRQDLAAHQRMPIIAVWHEPRYACGGAHEGATTMQAIWADLYQAGADFVFNGHNHYYQRWRPLDAAAPKANVDSSRGLTEIVVGGGGSSTYTVCSPPDSRIAKHIGGDEGMGVFFLALSSNGSYSFEYRLKRDGSVFDSGSGRSHHHY